MNHITYQTHGTCSSAIDIDIEDGIVKKIQYHGGCSGNTQGVSRLAEGRRVEEVIDLLGGIRCGFKPTSCPDQLATALREYLAKQ